MTGISKKFKGLQTRPGTAKKDVTRLVQQLFIQFLRTQKGKTFKGPGSLNISPFRVKTIPGGIIILPKLKSKTEIFQDQQSLFYLFRKIVKKGSLKPGELGLKADQAYLIPLLNAFFKSKGFQTVASEFKDTSPKPVHLPKKKPKSTGKIVKNLFKNSMRGFGFISAPEISAIPGLHYIEDDEKEFKIDLPKSGSFKPDSSRGWGLRGGWDEMEETAPPPGPDLIHGNVRGEEVKMEEIVVKDPPRSSYALLECDENVVMNETFTVRAGLSAVPGKNNAPGEKLERPEFSRGPYDLDIELLAPGFSMVKGNWKFSVKVTAEKPYPVREIRLKAKALDKGERFKARIIRAIYSTGGHTMGSIVIAVGVLREAGTEGKESEEIPPPPPQTVVMPPKQEVADLTVRITRGDRDRELVWSFDSPHSFLMKLIARKAPVMDIGKNSREFAQSLIDKVESYSPNPRKLYRHMLGKGKRVFRKTPAVFRRLLKEMKNKQLSQPTLLIQSEDPYIPWELMVLPEDYYFTASAAPFLSAQLRVGRWLFQSHGKIPPAKLSGGDMLVIAGTYDSPSFENLKHALEEAGELHRTYKAVEVVASEQKIMDCLENSPPGDILHFAVHGKYAPNSPDEGIVTIDEQYLDSTTIEGFDPMPRRPFVFLNACQIGSSSEMLGDYAGIAAAFLYIGASGVIAPLWSVNDEKAKEIALGFYQGAFKGISPAEILRKKRAGFNGANADATSVAYIYFGHPAMNMTRPKL